MITAGPMQARIGDVVLQTLHSGPISGVGDCLRLRAGIAALDSFKPSRKVLPETDVLIGCADIGVTSRFHDLDYIIRRSKIPQIDEFSLGKIFIVELVARFLRTHVAHNKSATRSKNPQSRARQACLVFDMVKCELAADKVEASRGKRKRRAIGADPGDVGRLETSLAQHSEWPIKAGVPGTRHGGAVRDQLISGAAADVQNREIGGSAPPGKPQKMRVRRSRPIGLHIVEMRDLIVIYAPLRPFEGEMPGSDFTRRRRGDAKSPAPG